MITEANKKNFSTKFTVTETCWLWNEGKDKDGYGKFRCGQKHLRAHRVSYLITFGDIPEGLMVCHSCDTPACVRPSHLFLGTALDNNRDRNAKGRNARLCKFTKEQALFVLSSNLPTATLARMLDASESRVRDIRKGRSWNHLPRNT